MRFILKTIYRLSIITALVLIFLIMHWCTHMIINYELIIMYIILAIIAKTILWNYDKLLLKLKPDWMELILFQ